MRVSHARTVDEHVGTSPPVYTLIDEPFQVVVQLVGARYTQTTEFFSEHFSLISDVESITM